MVRLSKNTRDRSVSPRRPKALLPKPKVVAPLKKEAFKKHENGVPEGAAPAIFIPRIK